jgi:anti-anti-sigma factor
VPFSEYWPADLPRALIERIAASGVFSRPDRDGDALATGADLEVRLSHRDEVCVLAVNGAVDLGNAARLRAVIRQVLSITRPPALVIDASGVTMTSVRGLAVLVEAAEVAGAAGARYAVAGLSALHLRMVREVAPGRDLTPLRHASVADAVTAVRS